jgi:glycosyltransferase involved in cell wall biosynthesis
VASERQEALRRLSRRPLVRVAVAIDWRVQPFQRRLARWGRSAQSAVTRNVVTVTGIGARPFRARRRRAVSMAVAALEPAGALRRQVSLVALDPDVVEHFAASDPRIEIVVVSNGEVATDAAPGPADVLRITGAGLSPVARLALGAGAAAGDVLCFLPSAAKPVTPDVVARLAAALHGDIAAATPTLLHPDRRGRGVTEHDLLVRCEGFDLEADPHGAPRIVARHAGAEPTVRCAPEDVAAGPLQLLTVDAAEFTAVGGLDSSDEFDVAAIDLCTRIRRRGGRVVHVPHAFAYDERAVPSRGALHSPVDASVRAWADVIDRHGPWLVRSVRPDSRPRWVITTAVPSAKIARLWGDTHLAEGLAAALRRLGQDVAVQTLDRRDSPATRSHDIHLVLRGVAPVRRTPGQRHLVWVISHPETFEIAECDEADLVLVASSRFAEHLRQRTSTPVEVLLQATDVNRFFPREPDPRYQHPVTIVAKTRTFMRDAVACAVEAGIRPAVYGSGWEDLVDPDLVVADHVDNEVLPAVYSSAGVVLNDHWRTMKAWGFVSNRIFDVLACGTPIISDDVAEIHDLFGDSVGTYRSAAELGDLVRRALADPDTARKRAMRGRDAVIAAHTFDHRARQLLDMVQQHGLTDLPA